MSFSIKFILFLLLTWSISPIVLGQTTTVATVSVSPSSVTSPANQNFTINVNVSKVNDPYGLYGWIFILTWNSTLLTAVNVTEGPFLKSGGGTPFFTYRINATDGSMMVDSTLTGNVTGVNGDGTLATVTFYVNNAGSCPLHLSEATLVNSQDNQIPSQTVDGYGYFAVVSSIANYKTVVGRGFGDGINVTIVNNSGNTETFNVTLYANTTAIGNQTTSNLLNGTFTLLIFTWNTTNFVYSNYTIRAYAGPIAGETDTSNQNITGSWVIVAGVGDITGSPGGWPDGKVDMKDIAYVATYFGTTSSSPSWKPNADINNDGKVDMKDIAIVAAHFGQSYLYPSVYP